MTPHNNQQVTFFALVAIGVLAVAALFLMAQKPTPAQTAATACQEAGGEAVRTYDHRVICIRATALINKE